MGSVWNGEVLRLSVFGESHGAAVGMVLDGFPGGLDVDWDAVQAFLARRSPSGASYMTKRREADGFEVLSGLLDGRTTGAPVCAFTRNTDTRSGDYDYLRDTPRPGHADLTGMLRYGGHNDLRGGGHFSARLTAPIVFAGALCLQWLAGRGVTVGAHIAQIGNVRDTRFPDGELSAQAVRAPGLCPFPVIDEAQGLRMLAEIESARGDADSVGGVVECAAVGMPAGVGSPIFQNVESRLAALLFAVPAVRGVEFGGGFALSGMRGSEANDPFTEKDGRVVTQTNRHGGSLGGITTGMPVVFRVSFKPTASIGRAQRTLNLRTGEPEELVVRGRHDPCVVPRAVPVVEAAAALCMTDLLLEASGYAKS